MLCECSHGNGTHCHATARKNRKLTDEQQQFADAKSKQLRIGMWNGKDAGILSAADNLEG